MVKMDWNQFKEAHPLLAELLLEEYHGFSISPASLEFEVWLDGNVRATDRSGRLHDPWVWCTRRQAWTS